MTANALVVRNVVKRFGDFTLGPLDLCFEPGRAYGLLGPNGAGKTTLLNILGLQLRPSAGTMMRGDEPILWGSRDWKNRFSYIRETPAFYDELSVAATLSLAGRLYDQWDGAFARTLARRLQLSLRKTVGTLSKGNKVKLGIVIALAHRAELLMLDEATAGLDPTVRNELQQVVTELMREHPDLMAIVSSHIFEDLERVATDVAILREGRIVFHSRMDAVAQLRMFRVPDLGVVGGLSVALTWPEATGACVVASERSPAAEQLSSRGFGPGTTVSLETIYHAATRRR